MFDHSRRLPSLGILLLLTVVAHPRSVHAGATQTPVISPELVLSGGEYYNRGAQKHRRGDYRGAIQDYTQALKLDDTLGDAYVARGSARDDAGDSAGALLDFDRALNLNHDNLLAYYNRGLAYLRLGRAQAALDDFDQVLHLRPDDPLAYYNRGIARQSLGDPSGARADLEAAAKIFSAMGNQESYQHVLEALKGL
ncbi:tetratricopeptide repeat protein [Anthocerotibacter panamensis]|uniref:tetratricopeptide repeat protein n=1 Tax=Anthocerotibacter panamensis TaxID=2857077 RepID=UPI001C401C08|nr:tetratricopeptide repeat protein [Anthocerotibacter panamensis]